MRLLLATGGSLHSERALHFAAQIAHLAHEPPVILVVMRTPWQGAQLRHLEERVDELLTPAFDAVVIETRVGIPSHEIGREAQKGQYDLVILGARQRNRLRTRLRGSVVVRVADQIPHSMLVAKGEPRPVRRVLLCDSGAVEPSLLDVFLSNGLEAIFESGATLTLLHVMSQISAGPGVTGEQLRANAETLMRESTVEGKLLKADIERLAKHGIEATPRIRHGLVVDEILAEAREHDYDLVIVGAHRRRGWEHYLLGDLARRLVAQIDRPILVVR